MNVRLPGFRRASGRSWRKGALMLLVLLAWLLAGLGTFRFLERERARLNEPMRPDVTIPELPLSEIRATATRAQGPPPPVPALSPAPSPPAVLD